ncbi:hypothetical protein, partial [Belnapia rosea]|uniref:hypothetical protein n=1 Tax=Belnapia rosea TaxID=938405 RepID=UPI0008818FB4
YGGGPSADRNLRVESLTFNDASVPGAAATLYSAGAKTIAFDEVDAAAGLSTGAADWLLT